MPGGKMEGREYVVRNPTRTDQELGSFKINLETGAWADFATSDRGGDLVSLYAYLRGLGQVEAARQLKNDLGLTGGNVHGEPGGQWKPVLPIPPDAGKAEPHPVHGKPDQTWVYRDEQGRRLGLACRFDKPDGSKQILPLTYCGGPGGRQSWRWQSWSVPRPLYGIDRLAAQPKAGALVVEGEKTADAAQGLFPDLVVITSPGGCKAAGKADWTHLKGRAVVIWAGCRYPWPEIRPRRG